MWFILWGDHIFLKSGRGYHRSPSSILELTPTGSGSWLYALIPNSAFNVLHWSIYTMGVFTQWKLANAENQGFIFREPVVKHLPAHHWLGFRSHVTQRKVPESISNTNWIIKAFEAENGRNRSAGPLLSRTMQEDELVEGALFSGKYSTNIWGPSMV